MTSFDDLDHAVDQAQVIIIDGRSGSGKTQLAAALADRTGAIVIHMDDLYAGWHGLAAGQELLREQIIEPLAAGEPARWQSWDWAADGRGPWHELSPESLEDQKLIIEGAGSLIPASVAWADLSVWLDAPEEVRRARALNRDGDDWWWQLWAEQEDEHLRRHRPMSVADLIKR